MAQRFFLFIVTLMLLGACQTGGSVEKVASFALEPSQSLAINARRLEVVDNWLMPLQAPYVEHELRTTPADQDRMGKTNSLAKRGLWRAYFEYF